MGTATVATNDFREFVAGHEAYLRAAIANRMRRSAPSDVDDALQETLVRIWSQFDAWPEDPSERRRYAHQLLSQASIDILRRGHGRKMELREIPTDFDTVEAAIEDELLEDHHLDVRAALVRLMDDIEHQSDDVDDARHEREWTALNMVLPALKPIEREVLFAYHPAGANRKGPQVAAELGITPGQARTALHGGAGRPQAAHGARARARA